MQNVPVMQITPAMRQAAQAQAAQILAARIPTYQYVPLNPAALQSLRSKIANAARRTRKKTYM